MLTEANKNKSCDICALCGKKRKLTFEHIPPRAALNNKPVKVVTGEALINQIGDSNKLPWDMNGVQYTINQKGSGRYSLCEECNNKTGHWYQKRRSLMQRVLNSIRKTAVKNAGIPSIKGIFEPQVPKELRRK